MLHKGIILRIFEPFHCGLMFINTFLHILGPTVSLKVDAIYNVRIGVRGYLYGNIEIMERIDRGAIWGVGRLQAI